MPSGDLLVIILTKLSQANVNHVIIIYVLLRGYKKHWSVQKGMCVTLCSCIILINHAKVVVFDRMGFSSTMLKIHLGSRLQNVASSPIVKKVQHLEWFTQEITPVVKYVKMDLCALKDRSHHMELVNVQLATTALSQVTQVSHVHHVLSVLEGET